MFDRVRSDQLSDAPGHGPIAQGAGAGSAATEDGGLSRDLGGLSTR